MGNWLDKDHSLPAIKNWIWGQFQALKGGIKIAANTDLNTIRDIGNYYCETNADAQTLSNIPIAAASMHAFTMKVVYGTGTGYVCQELIDYNTGIRYYRCSASASGTEFSTWRTFAQNSNTYTSPHCTTAAGTAAKTATCNNFKLKTNEYLHITFANTNTAASALTLNINGTGVKPIWINGNASSSSNHTLPAGTYIVFYDGTNYYFNTGSGLSDHLLPWGHRKTRLTSANIASDNSAGMRTFLATSAMNEGKPPSDAHIIHMDWDNAGKYAAQIGITTTEARLVTRTQSANGGTNWSDWRYAAMFGEGVTPAGEKVVVSDGTTGKVKEMDVTSGTQIATTDFVSMSVNNAVNGIFIGENLYQPFIQSEGTNTAATAGTSATIVPLVTKKYDYDPNESFEVLSDGGLKVKTSGLFKVTGAAMIKPNNNGNTTNLGVYLYVSKSGTETEEEVTLQSPGSSTLARVVTIGPKIISLESDDIVYLKSRCIGAAGTVDTTKSYLLIEQSFLHYEEVIPGTFGS